MATQSYEQLISGANKIRKNELPESNTAGLVGEQLLQMVNKQQEEHRQRVKGTTEYNVSVQNPTSGIDGSNKYGLKGAIAQVPQELRNIGLKVSFVNSDGTVEMWEYQGGTYTNLDNWKSNEGKLASIRDEAIDKMMRKVMQFQISVPSALLRKCCPNQPSSLLMQVVAVQ